MTPERRREVARLGGAARWGVGKTPKATHEGELQLGDLVIPCAVLDDGRRVLSQRSVGKALGRGYGGKDWRTAAAEGGDAGQLPFFLVAANLKPFISDELVVLASRPIKYRRRQGGLEGFGIEANLLPRTGQPTRRRESHVPRWRSTVQPIYLAEVEEVNLVRLSS